MKTMTTYLVFDGNAEDAMMFYQKCLGGNMTMMQKFGDGGTPCAPGTENRIMHARLEMGSAMLMASDTMVDPAKPGQPFKAGENFSIAVECSDPAEQDRHWAGFSDGATITMPLQDTFWGARFGMLRDKFGINWMFNCEHKKPA